MGYGMLPIDTRAMAEIFGAYDEWNLEKLPHEVVHDKLLLPPDWRVKHVGMDFYRRAYLVMLEADELPEVVPGEMVAQVLPILTMEDGVVRLSELRIDLPSGPAYWPRRPGTNS